MGDWLPTSVFGYLHALCAYLRMIYVALYLIFFSGVEYDVIFCDQVSCGIQELTTCLFDHHSLSCSKTSLNHLLLSELLSLLTVTCVFVYPLRDTL